MEARAMGRGMGDTGGKRRWEKGREEASKARSSCIMAEGVNQIEEDGEARFQRKVGNTLPVTTL